jgi:hypothetical protein
MYSDSVLDSATTGYFFELHVITPLPIHKQHSIPGYQVMILSWPPIHIWEDLDIDFHQLPTTGLLLCEDNSSAFQVHSNVLS